MYYDLEPNPVTSSTSPAPSAASGSQASASVKTVVVPSASPATEEDIRKRKMDAAGIKQQPPPNSNNNRYATADIGGSGMSVGSGGGAGDDDGYGYGGGDDAAGSSKELTEEQRIERRERNREHAKRSRLRKKFLLESLQEQIHGLEEQIDGLKGALKQEVPQRAEDIIAKICGDKEKYTPLPMPSGFGPVKTIMEPDFRLMSALSGSQQNFAISDPTLPDNPIVYVSQGFLDLTGYTLDQVLGRNCRFLQGPGTDQSAVEVIRKGIAEGVDTSVCLLNYKVRAWEGARLVDPQRTLRTRFSPTPASTPFCFCRRPTAPRSGTSSSWRPCGTPRATLSTTSGSSARSARPSSRSTPPSRGTPPTRSPRPPRHELRSWVLVGWFVGWLVFSRAGWARNKPAAFGGDSSIDQTTLFTHVYT
jgi:PAS domain-containing protein